VSGRAHRVSECPLPETWRDGPTSAAVEQIVEGLSNSYSISPEMGQVLARIIVQEERTDVLEFGAGMSSQVIAAAVAENGGGRLTSVEENPEWCEEAWGLVRDAANLDALLLQGVVRLTVDGRGIYYGYAPLSRMEERGPYDLMFLDAPWGRFGRDGGLHLAMNHLAIGGLIVLDDARRRREQKSLHRWMVTYPDLRLVCNDLDAARGIAVLRKEAPAAAGSKPDLRRRIALLQANWVGAGYELLRSSWSVRRYRRRGERMRGAG